MVISNIIRGEGPIINPSGVLTFIKDFSYSVGGNSFYVLTVWR